MSFKFYPYLTLDRDFFCIRLTLYCTVSFRLHINDVTCRYFSRACSQVLHDPFWFITCLEKKSTCYSLFYNIKVTWWNDFLPAEAGACKQELKHSCFFWDSDFIAGDHLHLAIVFAVMSALHQYTQNTQFLEFCANHSEFSVKSEHNILVEDYSKLFLSVRKESL